VPSVTLPPKGIPRQRFLERHEAAALLRAAHRLGHKHIARFILIGLYTGTRHAAILSLRWLPGLSGGYVDLERMVLFRRGTAERETKKRRPPMRLPPKLALFLTRWRQADATHGVTHVVHYHGRQIAKERRAFEATVKAAGLEEDVTPHVLRHTFATWALWEGKTIWEVAGLMGASAKMVDETYGHHLGAGVTPPQRRQDGFGR
jgi:integrase